MNDGGLFAVSFLLVLQFLVFAISVCLSLATG